MAHCGAHLAGITGPGGGEEDFSLPGSSGPEGQHAQAKRKLIGYTYLVRLCLLDLFSLFLPLREEIFL